ncbi:GNAT family N-acetyltransferase [Hymenobacter sp. DH14]|uniref:GNAT family N-acetyltransferase n=1 Tax=Hymenobacter cyanobacteriorum TaxID=2926463 RepID=A0A9X1VCJ9_9BACT|nr:GNAT family protein [Hymenobacter cyanobacteriorum]MCI1186406.1 GNAT family N-acetyltransferase [Hymenobacter cyanobacteriorum]
MNLPPYSRFPVLASATVLLRPVQPADAESLFEISFYDARPAQNPPEAAAMQARIAADYQLGTAIHWAIVRVATAEVVGTLGFYRGFAHSTGELGCVLKPAFRGLGLMRAAMQLAIDFGLHEMKLAQLVAVTTRPNEAAIRLLERLGFAETADLPGEAVAYVLRRVPESA